MAYCGICPSRETIERKVRGLLEETERQAVALHVIDCHDCKAIENAKLGEMQAAITATEQAAALRAMTD